MLDEVLVTNMTFERTLSLATQKLFQPKTFYNIRDRTNAILEFSECPESSYLSKTDIFDFGKKLLLCCSKHSDINSYNEW